MPTIVLPTPEQLLNQGEMPLSDYTVFCTNLLEEIERENPGCSSKEFSERLKEVLSYYDQFEGLENLKTYAIYHPVMKKFLLRRIAQRIVTKKEGLVTEKEK